MLNEKRAQPVSAAMRTVERFAGFPGNVSLTEGNRPGFVFVANPTNRISDSS
jgi:hypothetical protein